jgi:hypothetical protein
MELKDFQQVEIAAHSSVTLKFTITANMLSYIGPDLNTVLELGEFTVFVGPNSYLPGAKTNYTKESAGDSACCRFSLTQLEVG